jgi:hypothetical protein
MSLFGSRASFQSGEMESVDVSDAAHVVKRVVTGGCGSVELPGGRVLTGVHVGTYESPEES